MPSCFALLRNCEFGDILYHGKKIISAFFFNETKKKQKTKQKLLLWLPKPCTYNLNNFGVIRCSLPYFLINKHKYHPKAIAQSPVKFTTWALSDFD